MSYILPKLGDMLFIAIAFGVVMYGPKLFNLDGDLGRHITIGNYILSSGVVPVKDIFSHTMTGELLVPHEWLAQIAFALAHKLMGLSGDVFLTALVIGLAFAVKYREIIERGTPALVAAIVLIWAAGVSSIHWLARPHIFTLLFTAVWSCQLEKLRTGNGKSFFFFPFLMLLWANTHGAFIAGFVIWGVYFFEWVIQKFQNAATWVQGRQLAMIGGISFAATFINPSGYRLWTTSLGYIQNRYLTSHTVEYMPPNFQDPAMWPFALMIFYGLLSLNSKKNLALRESLLMAGWMFMSLFSMRNIPLFAVITIPAFASLLHSQTSQINWFAGLNERIKNVESQLKGGAWSTLAVILIGLALYRGVPLDTARQGNQYDPQAFPVDAITWLQANPQHGNMFNHFTWGGYILYKSWPEFQVFIDGQTDFYGEALTREYEDVISLSNGWRTILEKYDVDWAIIPTDSQLAEALIEQGWDVLYKDKTAVVLKK